MTQHVTFRASPVLLARIEELAEARKSTRSAAIKAAILEATLPDHATAVPDEQEVLALLSEAARGGSVAAMKELRAYHRSREPLERGGPLGAVEDLAARRARGGP